MMIKPVLILSILLFTNNVMSQTSVRLEIVSLPHYHASGSILYASGSFNGWNARDKNFQFRQDSLGNYFIEMILTPGNYEYKITRGGWDKAECKKEGENINNRVLKIKRDTSIKISVEEWTDRFPSAPKKSTASKNVQIIDTAFLIPQLKRTRRIWIYLPESYSSGSGRYPVLYMQDGQNVFDDATSYSGEWGVDEYLDSRPAGEKEWIVVAIDNGGIKRLNEYNPYDFRLNGNTSGKSKKGEGRKYADFLVKTLKPFIDKNYRTSGDKANTAISGSSMGGLISLFTLLKHPDVFGAAGIFSPAFSLSPKIFDELKKMGKKLSADIYFYGGKLEGEKMISDMQMAHGILTKNPKIKIKMVIREDGRHNEPTWRKEFPLFFEWINFK